MLVKNKIKIKKIFFLMKQIFNIKKKKISILGPYGNYSYNLLIKKVNFKFIYIPFNKIKNIKKNDNLIPIENNNGGIVVDSINLIKNKKFFIHNVVFLNINHKCYVYKKKKNIYLHNQSLKQIKNNIKFNFKNYKKKIIFSNSNINNGIMLGSSCIKKIFLFNLFNTQLKDNVFNKTKFLITKKITVKKQIISIITKYNIIMLKIIKNILNIYTSKKIFFIEFFFLSFRQLIFIMKYLKKKKIKIVGFYSII